MQGLATHIRALINTGKTIILPSLISLSLLGFSYLISAQNLQHVQIPILLETRKPYRYWSDPSKKTITLEIQQITPDEIKAFDLYDETYIRRVQMKDLGGVATEITITLREPTHAASISFYEEPPRIVLDIFDRKQETLRDPVNSLPLAVSKTNSMQNENEHSTSTWNDPKIETPRESQASNLTHEGKAKLLKPSESNFENEAELLSSMNTTKDGLGSFWKNYPRYIYRLQNALIDADNLKREPIRSNVNEAISNIEGLADYAGRLYDFGHETKALTVYQTVLKKNPNLFTSQPIHLWRFAESHLAHGNLSIADGYYQMLVDKYPGHALNPYAQMRRVDIELIRKLQNTSTLNWSDISRLYEIISPKNSSELVSQITIRRSFLDAPSKSENLLFGKELPFSEESKQQLLTTNLNQLESSQTAYFSFSLVIKNSCKDNAIWTQENAKLADQYFKRFTGESTDNFRKELSECVRKQLEKHLISLHEQNQSELLVQDYESLPNSMKSVNKNPLISWIIGESYRRLSAHSKAIPFYERAFAEKPLPTEQLKAYMGLLQSSEAVLKSLNGRSQADINQRQIINRKLKSSDEKANQIWQDLSIDEKNSIYTTNRSLVEKNILESSLVVRTPASMALYAWGKELSSEKSSGSDTGVNGASLVSPGFASIKLITKLADRFEKVGDNNSKRESLALLKNMKPSSSSEDEKTISLWAQHLYQLANEMREENKFLDAGKLYKQIGDEAGNWPQRAESLYRGGLMLFRAGQKAEAIDAFKKASEDNNNLFYANLAKERLNQLEP